MDERILVAGGGLQDGAGAVGETTNAAKDDAAGGDFDGVRAWVRACTEEHRATETVGVERKAGNVINGRLDVDCVVADNR